MKRRHFIQNMAALAAAPALPIKALASAGAAIPKPARFWAIYMSHLHGTCTPASLAKATGINPSVAQGYLSRLIADGVLTPTNIVSKAISAKAVQSPDQPTDISKRMKKFLKRDILEEDTKSDCDSSPVNHAQAELAHDTNIPTPDPTAKNPD